jgi:hypothetical protein
MMQGFSFCLITHSLRYFRNSAVVYRSISVKEGALHSSIQAALDDCVAQRGERARW